VKEEKKKKKKTNKTAQWVIYSLCLGFRLVVVFVFLFVLVFV